MKALTYCSFGEDSDLEVFGSPGGLHLEVARLRGPDPRDSGYQKIRTARYEVLNEVSNPEEEKATTGATSPTVWTTPAPSAAASNRRFKKLSKAIDRGTVLIITYQNAAGEVKDYLAIPEEIHGKYLELELVQGGHRTFLLERIVRFHKA